MIITIKRHIHYCICLFGEPKLSKYEYLLLFKLFYCNNQDIDYFICIKSNFGLPDIIVFKSTSASSLMLR